MKKPKDTTREEEDRKWAVYIRNFVTGEWNVMKLRYDPRTKKNGLAIYEEKDKALLTEGIVYMLGGDTIETCVGVNHDKT